MVQRDLSKRKLPPVTLFANIYLKTTVLLLFFIFVTVSAIFALLGLKIPPYISLTITVSSILYAIADFWEFGIDYGQDVMEKQKRKGYRNGVNQNHILTLEKGVRKYRLASALSFGIVPFVYWYLNAFERESFLVNFLIG
ncbi:hypothetical protein RCG17_06685 [Neobacillus sp. PS3-12]|uniref:hypothetical protein n=1 Tax=Neobacillus sp. PS3-12 TaxID=3070677 RepID=UPI0027E1C5BF|nr:hypothetical protein [Neobacillus sp. PS3-12]WML54327.1 hypothetical protein RCG17_06685 [Neobacillus sp. PS3-12]